MGWPQKSFEFLYARRAQTTLWDLDRSGSGPAPGANEPPGCWRIHGDGRREWYRATVELRPNDEDDDVLARARDLAEEELRRQHPGHDPAD